MPVYDHICRTCGSETEAVNAVSKRRTNAPVCCDERMDIIIKVAPQGYVQREVYYKCPVTNKEVTTMRDRKYIMESEGLVDANDFDPLKKVAQKNKERAEQKAYVESLNAPEAGQKEAEEWNESTPYNETPELKPLSADDSALVDHI